MPDRRLSTKLPDAAALADLVTSVTQTMCGISFAPADRGTPLPQCWRMVLVPISGPHEFEVALFTDEASCQALSASLFSTNGSELDISIIEDSLRELLNMAAGQIKRAVAPDHELGLPKTIREQDLRDEHRRARDTGVLLKTAGPIQLFIWITAAAGRESPGRRAAPTG